MKHPEDSLQKLCIQWLELARPDVLYWHVPNGGYRSKRTAGLMKALGVRTGVADLAFILPGGRAGFIELKAKSRKPTDEQLAFGHAVTTRGGMWQWCNSFENFCGIVDTWYGRRNAEPERKAAKAGA